jgi:hypothetical protein
LIFRSRERLAVIFVACRVGKTIMKNPVYKLIELSGTSTTSIEDAVASAIRRAPREGLPAAN